MGEGPGREPGADDPGPLLPTPVAVRQSRRAQWLAGGRVPALGGTTGTTGTGRADRGAGAGDRAVRAAADAWTVRRLNESEHAVTGTCLISFDRNRYSVLSTLARRTVQVRAYADRIVVRCGEEVVAEHPRYFGRNRTIYDPWHYLP